MITQFYIELLEGPGQGRTFTFTKDRVRVGRAPDNDLVLVDGSVSRYHCELLVRGAAVELSDAHSTNGVKLNGRKLQDVVMLRDLDVIELGRLQLRFHQGNQPTADGTLSAVQDTNATSLLSNWGKCGPDEGVMKELKAVALRTVRSQEGKGRRQ